MAISLGGFSGGGGAGAVTSVNGQTGVVVVSGDDVAADHSASHYTAANANVDGHLSGIDTKLGTLAAGLIYKGTFNATTGLTGTGGNLNNALQGDLYVINTAGTIYGQTWAINDHLLINADMGGVIDNAKIDKIDNTEPTNVLITTNNLSDLTDDATARSNLGVAIGTDVQAYDAQLNDIAGLATTDNGFIVGNGSSFVLETGSTVRTSLGLGSAAQAATTDFLASTAGLNDLSDVSYTGGAGIDNYVLTYDHSSTSWGAEAVPSAPVTSVNGNTGAVTLSGDDLAADHSASHYTAANANVDGHLSGIDSKFGTLATVATSGAYSDLSGTPSLATVATTGAYSDLSGTPTLATVATTGAYGDLSGTPSLATVATTGAYSDLSGTPTLGTASAAASTDFLSATGPDTLGGNLDVGSSDIVSSSNAAIELAPDGTGSVVIKGNTAGGGTNTGHIKLNCEQNNHFVKIAAPLHSAFGSNPSYTLTLPADDGDPNEVLQTDGSGNLSWVAQSTGGAAPNVTTDSSGTDTTISTTTGIEEVHLISNGASNVVITLPAAATAGAGYKYQIKRLGTGNVTVDPNGSEYIDHSAQTTFAIGAQYDSITLCTDGSNWYLI